MNTQLTTSFATHANVFERGLSLEQVRQRAPAVFAERADEGMSARYTFIPTHRVLSGLLEVGFEPVDARQTHTRTASVQHARHLIRLRRRAEAVQLRDAVPEIVFLNSHDGSSTYQLRMGLFRVVCTNGMIVSHCAFPGYCVSHRGNVVEEVVAAAVDLAARFPQLAVQVERMQKHSLTAQAQFHFAQAALQLRYGSLATCGIQASQVLTCRRVEDRGDDVWTVLNRVQENLFRGGMSRRTLSGRLSRTRRITAIRTEVRLNSELWDLAMDALVA